MNEISGYALTALGGFLGVEVFGLLLNRFGIGPEKRGSAEANGGARASGGS